MVCGLQLPFAYKPKWLPGVLVSGKGTRFILANTEQLHTKIHDMSDRIRSLEEALQTVQAQCTLEPHPLLQTELLSIKSTMGLYSGNQGSSDANHHATHVQLEGRMDIDSPERGSSEDTLLAVEHIPIQVIILRVVERLWLIDHPPVETCGARDKRAVCRRDNQTQPMFPIIRVGLTRTKFAHARIHPESTSIS